LENANTDITSKYEGETQGRVAGGVANISLSQIETNPFQPRTNFEKDALLELVSSIKEHGIIQPITVRKLGYDKYQLISGERRFKASSIAGLKDIPAYIRIANDQSMLEMALVENIQREELDAVEIAISYKRLIEECNLTQEALSQKIGKQRSTITNYLRLLKLPAEIQLGIRNSEISMGHARALINIEDQQKQLFIFSEILENDLSVRQVEDLARNTNQKASVSPGKKNKKTSSSLPFEYEKINEKLRNTFKTKVMLNRQENGRGKIVIPFSSDDELKRILKVLNE
jgi:ParB family chromosome partitioning protein